MNLSVGSIRITRSFASPGVWYLRMGRCLWRELTSVSCPPMASYIASSGSLGRLRQGQRPWPNHSIERGAPASRGTPLRKLDRDCASSRPFHSEAPHREDPDGEQRHRGRAEAGHGPVRRPERRDGAARRPAPGAWGQPPGRQEEAGSQLRPRRWHRRWRESFLWAPVSGMITSAV